MTGGDTRRCAPAAERNLSPILQCLQRHAPKDGTALEIASGSGQQIVQFAANHPNLSWQASDRDAANLASIKAWAAFAPAPNLRAPIVLDASQPGWATTHCGLSLIVMVNLLHLISTPAAVTVLQECAAALMPKGKVMIYGPFLREGLTTSDGDARFDAELRGRDAMIGYKDLAWVMAEMGAAGLCVQTEEMPANNLMLIGQKT